MQSNEREIGGLRGPFRGPLQSTTTGHPEQIVILLHGWGADGSDLIDLAEPLSQFLPHAAFFSPHAPHTCSASAFGREWFDLTDRSQMHRHAIAAMTQLHTALDGVRTTFELPAHKMILSGFSQGGMMSLLAGLCYASPLAGIVSIAGALLADDEIPEAHSQAAPVMMIHGDADPVVPFQALDLGLTQLKSKGYQTSRLACAGVAHGISPEAVTEMGEFAQAALED